MENLYSGVDWENSSNTSLNATNLGIMDKGIKALDNRLSQIFDLIFPIGSIVVTSTNTEPSELYGGTWELLSKDLRYSYYNNDSGIFTLASTTVGYAIVYATVQGDFVRVRINYKRIDGNTMSDTALVLGTINLPVLGVDRLTLSNFSVVGCSDGGNSLTMAALDTSGKLTHNDVIGGTSIASNTEIYYDILLQIPDEYKKDEYCDKFYWKRINEVE